MFGTRTNVSDLTFVTFSFFSSRAMCTTKMPSHASQPSPNQTSSADRQRARRYNGYMKTHTTFAIHQLIRSHCRRSHTCHVPASPAHSRPRPQPQPCKYQTLGPRLASLVVIFSPLSPGAGVQASAPSLYLSSARDWTETHMSTSSPARTTTRRTQSTRSHRISQCKNPSLRPSGVTVFQRR